MPGDAGSNIQDIYSDGATVTPHDTNLLPRIARSLHISVAGALKVTTIDGTDLTFPSVPVGVFPIRCKRVWATGTAATGIVALW